MDSDRSVGIIYGRFASGKSFIAFDLLLHLVYGMAEWHGIELPASRAMGCSLRAKVVPASNAASTRSKGITTLTKTPTNRVHAVTGQFRRARWLRGTGRGHQGDGKGFKAVVVDTVGRALPGEDMFDPKSITRFMETCNNSGNSARASPSASTTRTKPAK